MHSWSIDFILHTRIKVTKLNFISRLWKTFTDTKPPFLKIYIIKRVKTNFVFNHASRFTNISFIIVVNRKSAFWTGGKFYVALPQVATRKDWLKDGQVSSIRALHGFT